MKSTVAIASALLSVCAFAVGARANVTILNVTQGSSTADSVVYTNTFGTGGTPTSSDITGAFSVTGLDSTHAYYGTFEVPNGYGTVGTAYPVTLVNFVGYTSGPASYDATTDMYFVHLQGWKGTFQAVNAVNGLTNVLTFDFSSATTAGLDHYNGTMSWNNGDSTATINIGFRTPGSSTDFASIFNSDFLDYSNPNSLGSYYISENMTGSLSLPVSMVVNSNGTIQSFTANPGFQFSSNPQPPSK